MVQFVAIAVVVVLIILILAMGYVKAPPDKAFIISGLRKNPKVLIGKAGIKIPFLERKDMLIVKQISIDVKTNGFIPTFDFIGVDIDAVCKVRVMTDGMVMIGEAEAQRSVKGIDLAAKNFLNLTEDRIAAALMDSLQGNMREIIGTVELRELCNDRKKFGDEVQSKAQKDMNALGIEIISCNIQKITDENDLIPQLGQDNMSQIQKDASIAKANAEKDVAVAEADAKRISNEAEVKAQTDIAEKQTALAIRQANLKQTADIEKAKSDAAYEIQKQEQQKTINQATVDAEIIKTEREAELKQKAVDVRKQELAAEIERTADAEKYKAEQEAEAKLIREKKEAEASLFSAQKEAEGIRAKGDAEAAAIRAKGLAEAEAMEKRAEAYQKYNGAAMAEMMIKIMPQMAAEIAKPLGAIDKINIYDSGSGEKGASQISGNMPVVMKQVFDTMSEATGVEFSEIMKAGTITAKTDRNIHIDGMPEISIGKKDDENDKSE